MKIEVRLAIIEQELSRLRADRRLLLVQLARLLGMSPQTENIPRVSGNLKAVTPVFYSLLDDAKSAWRLLWQRS